MRYANTKHSHAGIGVEPQPRERDGAGSIKICDEDYRHIIKIHDREQLKEVIGLLRHASIINGWGPVQ